MSYPDSFKNEPTGSKKKKRRNTVRDASSRAVNGSKDKTLAGVERDNSMGKRKKKKTKDKQNFRKNWDE
jgi:hypothetical protein